MAFNTTEVPITIERNSLPATFTIVTPNQAHYLIPKEPKLLETDNLSKTTKTISKQKVAQGQLNTITLTKTQNIGFQPKTTHETTPDKPVYSKNQRVSIYLKDDLLPELALLQ